ncbi:MAG: serine/threonine protein kinase [Mojavia pulchra JT2-VF2]|jgi:serine/threonine protein kinase|uniref:non-specific serine/threonine protein kinase n=1 Tax=Mojavia pulchra JT2-VF2 TaxID=287848 RepID=A0A951Q3V8_9NOST|nr:serine/threonine protein kinase [Mojavia pulchra JT2-VF2]
MICCLNPDCPNPQNPDGSNFCLSCGTGLVSRLRNRYRIIQPLGRGGFARTYLAEDIDKLNEQCVVKQLIRGQFYGGGGSEAQKKATELFEREAKRLQELGKHDQIPTLFGYFKEDDYLYLVQELIEGQNLLQELKQQGVFNEIKIRQLLSDLLPVLELIHQQQVIHRDIKPENIIRRQHDRKLVLIDFGVSKQKTETINTTPGTIIGSLGYAPIEQIQFGEAYPASDLYSLGIACFYLLTNVPPSQLWMRQGFSWTNKWRSQMTQPISEALGQILDKLLLENHEQRYQSAKEVLQDLNSQTDAHWSVLQTIISPQRISPPQTPVQQHTSYLPQFSMKKLLPGVVIASTGSSFLAIVLLSFLGTTLISSGLWFLILGAVVFTQSRSLFEKIYLFIIAVITNLFIVFVAHNWQINNPLQSGTNGLIIVVLLVTLAGLLAFILMGTSQLVDKLITKFF